MKGGTGRGEHAKEHKTKREKQMSVLSIKFTFIGISRGAFMFSLGLIKMLILPGFMKDFHEEFHWVSGNLKLFSRDETHVS